MSKTDEKLSGPPEDLTNAGMLEWFELSSALFEADNWKIDLLPKVDQLARLKDQRNRLLDELGLEPQPESTSSGFQPNTKYMHLADPEEFDRRFDFYSPKYDTYPEAWERVEWEHRQTFGKNKYTSYDSYRNTRKKRITK